MFNRLSFKGQPDEYTLSLGYTDVDAQLQSPSDHASGGVLTQNSIDVKWLSSEPEASILDKVQAAVTTNAVKEERVTFRIGTAETPGFWGVVSAASYNREAQVCLEVTASTPALRSIELLSISGCGNLSTSLGVGIWSALNVSSVTRLRCNEGVTSLWDANLLQRFSLLRVLNLSHANLNSLPGMVGTLKYLQELRLVGNHLKILPPEIGQLKLLRVLAVDSNELSILPGELKNCAALEELTLENNRLSSVLLHFGALRNLRTLLLFGNPLEFLPEIGPCRQLRTLSVANLRVHADNEFATYEVELAAPTNAAPTYSINLFDSKPTDKLRPLFSLMLRRSSGHHPLLAGALRHLAEDPKNRDLMAKQENALQQLILMALNDNAIVVQQTCKTLSLLAEHAPFLAEAIIDSDAGSMLRLMASGERIKELASLEIVAAISQSSQNATKSMLTDDMLETIRSLAMSATVDVRVAALCALGNLAFSPAGKARLSSCSKTMDILLRLSGTTQSTGKAVDAKVKAAAVRALAVLGDVPAVGRAVGRSPAPGRGLRVLSLDGGGMKGMATVCLLRALEERTGRPIHQMFDLVVGTSTGGLLAVALGLRKFSLDECEAVYKVLGQRVFSRPTVNKEKDESWMETFYRTFHSKTQHVRAVVVGYKHDATVYEALLKEYCSFEHDRRCLSDKLIDTACLDVPKIALVATLASRCPAEPFVFRNYELPLATEAERRSMGFMDGSSKHAVWQAVRASSAAIYYLDDFTCGTDKFQDGAVVANNPGVIALQEARALWPNTPIEVLVSVGTGSTPKSRRDKGLSAFMDTGNILIESATSVERVHEALATMTPLMPNMKYYRFEPVDERCGMELDEIDPEKWLSLEIATQEYVEANAAKFNAAALSLGGGLGARVAAQAETDTQSSVARLTLGLRRSLLVILSQSPAPEPAALEVAAVLCSRLSSCSAVVDMSMNATQVDTLNGSPLHASPRSRRNGSGRTDQQQYMASPVSHAVSMAAPTVPSSPVATLPAPNVVEVDLAGTLGSMLRWFSPSKESETQDSSFLANSKLVTPDPRPTALLNADADTRDPEDIIASSGDNYHISSPASHQPFHDAALSPTISSSQQDSRVLVEDEIGRLEHSIMDAVPAVGVIHLGLQSCSEGPVLRWQETYSAVTVPSTEADALVRMAGADSRTSLLELFERRGRQIEFGTTTVRAISTHYRHLPSGSSSCVVLVQHSSPLVILDVAAISRLRSVLTRKLVVSSDVLPIRSLQAFSSAGCLAVLAPSRPLSTIPGCTGGALADFFGTLYAEVQSGTECVEALNRAEAIHPAMDGVFHFHY